MKKRKQFGGDVKFHVVLRLLKGEASAVELAKKIDCHPTIIGTWKDRFLAHAPALFESPREDKERERRKERRSIIIPIKGFSIVQLITLKR